MKKYLVSIYSWENPKLYWSESEFSDGDKVIVESDFGNDIGIVQLVDVETKEDPESQIARKATERDTKVDKENIKKKNKLLKFCHTRAKEMKLEMKIIDVHITLGKGAVVVAFTADGRVDFRELVKEISKEFRRSIRMQQIGSRDEARRLGGCGICGRELCCVKFPGELPSISTEMARVQQVAHRGSERISGLCGRLMCCLSYETEQYKRLLEGMPEMHSKVKTQDGKGEVVEINALKQEIRVRLENGQFITVKKEDIG